MSRKLQIKRGAKAALPPLAPGELAMTTDEKTLYYGTGAENIPVARKEHTHTAGDVGAAPSSHVGDGSHASVAEKNAWDGKAAGNHTHTAGEIGAAPESHKHGPIDQYGQIPSAAPGSFLTTALGGGIMTQALPHVQPGTDDTTYRIRNAALVTSAPSNLGNGDIAFVYS